MSSEIADLERELTNMVNLDFRMFVLDRPELGHVRDFIAITEVFGKNLAEIKKFLLKSAAKALAKSYPLAVLSNTGGNYPEDPMVISISFRERIPLGDITRLKVKLNGDNSCNVSLMSSRF